MEGLESPRENGEAIMQFDAESSDGVPAQDYLHPKVYFYTDDEELQLKVFPQEWFTAMSGELNEVLNATEPPFFTVSVLLLCIFAVRYRKLQQDWRNAAPNDY